MDEEVTTTDGTDSHRLNLGRFSYLKVKSVALQSLKILQNPIQNLSKSLFRPRIARISRIKSGRDVRNTYFDTSKDGSKETDACMEKRAFPVKASASLHRVST